jgi:tetratricopeptide (TPR) repeat protein
LYVGRKKLEVQIATLGSGDHAEIGITYTDMAFVIEKQGAFADAQLMHEKALAIQLSLLGPDDIAVASAYNGLALCQKSQGKFDEAFATHQKALTIKLKVLGPDHADLAVTYHGMGVAVDNQDKFDKAMSLYKHGLDIRLKTLGTVLSSFATERGMRLELLPVYTAAWVEATQS